MAVKLLPFVCSIFTVLVLSGCGGSLGNIGGRVDISPETVTLAASATQVFEIHQVEVLALSAEWTIKEAGGGTITPIVSVPPSATYTAPSTPGTYHVRAKVTLSNQIQTVEAVVTVTP